MATTEAPGILAEHYQKTFELTLSTWEQRNRTFLILLGVVGAAALLTFNVSQAQPLLVDVIANVLGIDDAARRADLRTSFPYGLIQSILLMVVLYLMLILYHRTTLIIRNYQYLAAVEAELREGLELEPRSVSFTREGTFYRHAPHILSKWIAVTYVLMLGVLLASFLGMRIVADFGSKQYAFAAMDMVIALPTLFYFCAYAHASSGLIRAAVDRVWGRLRKDQVSPR